MQPQLFWPQPLPPVGRNKLASGIHHLMTRFSSGRLNGSPNAFSPVQGPVGFRPGLGTKRFATSGPVGGFPGNNPGMANAGKKTPKAVLDRLLGLIRKKDSTAGVASAPGVSGGGSSGMPGGAGYNPSTRFSPGARLGAGGSPDQGTGYAGPTAGGYAGTRFNPSARSRTWAGLDQRTNPAQGTTYWNPNAQFGQSAHPHVNQGNPSAGANLWSNQANPGTNPEVNLGTNSGVNLGTNPTAYPGAVQSAGLSSTPPGNSGGTPALEKPGSPQGEQEAPRTLEPQDASKYEWVGVLIERILDALERKGDK